MAGRVIRRWSDLSERDRRLLIAAAAVEGALKAVALADLKRRPASEVRGPKQAWVAGLVAVNSFGAAPLAYFVFGRRRNSEATDGSQGRFTRRRVSSFLPATGSH